MGTGSGFALLIAAASVSQLVQVTINFFRAGPEQPVPSVTGTTTVVEVRYTRAESSTTPCSPASAGFLEDPYEREFLYSTCFLSFLTGGILAVGASAMRCCWTAQPVIQQHGRGAQL